MMMHPCPLKAHGSLLVSAMQVLVHARSHWARMMAWVLASIAWAALGLAVHGLGMPFNKNLYTPSYALVRAWCQPGAIINFQA